MNRSDFLKYYNLLIEIFPNEYSSKHKAQLIFEHVKELDLNWFIRKVDSIIMGSNRFFDWEEAARGERLALQRLKQTKEVLDAHEAMIKNSSESGLTNVLRKLGKKSLLDAIGVETNE